jgi:hypothetical protein
VEIHGKPLSLRIANFVSIPKARVAASSTEMRNRLRKSQNNPSEPADWDGEV